MSTFEPVIVRVPSAFQFYSQPPTDSFRRLHPAAFPPHKRWPLCTYLTNMWSYFLGHRWQRAPSWSPGLYGREAAAERPEDCCRALRSPQHLWRVLPGKAYVYTSLERQRPRPQTSDTMDDTVRDLALPLLCGSVRNNMDSGAVGSWHHTTPRKSNC